jgi:hypothetical protein
MAIPAVRSELEFGKLPHGELGDADATRRGATFWTFLVADAGETTPSPSRSNIITAIGGFFFVLTPFFVVRPPTPPNYSFSTPPDQPEPRRVPPNTKHRSDIIQTR